MRELKLDIAGRTYRIDTETGFDLSIPIDFNQPGLSAFGAGRPQAEIYRNADFVGDTRAGGSCNVQRYSLIPHCHGTHTECAGHVLDNELSVCDLRIDCWIPATLISLTVETATDCAEQYPSQPEPGDFLISKRALCKAIATFDAADFHEALIIRTRPNHVDKVTQDYQHAAYFSNDAMREIASSGVRHLLVDLPSVDRMNDQGQLSNHRIFWDLPEQGHVTKAEALSTKTITELIYAADSIADGYYLLNLQLAPFRAEAVPSRPLIFPVLSA